VNDWKGCRPRAAAMESHLEENGGVARERGCEQHSTGISCHDVDLEENKFISPPS